MNLWLWTAAAVLVSLVPCGIVCFRGDLADRLVGLEMTGALVTIELLLFAEGFHRPSFFDVPLALAFLSFGGGMVFARFVQRWL
jgi:multicomponent Na+:H+ antiporter subunit F